MVADIHERRVKWSKWNVVSRHFHAKDDEKAIIAWKLDFDRILRVFNVCSIISVKTNANFLVLIPEGTCNECERNNHFYRLTTASEPTVNECDTLALASSPQPHT
jgi:hypothetical protein